MAAAPADAGTALAPETVLDTVRLLAAELHPNHAPPALTLDSTLDRDAGLDSLARVELLARLERASGRRLPEQQALTAETVRDLWRLLAAAAPVTEPVAVATRAPAPAAVEPAPESAQTLWDVLAWHVRAHPERPHITLLAASGAEETLDYATLAREAEAIGAGLQARGVRPGQTVAIMLPTCREYFTSFFGTLAAGAIPVPIYPPARATQIEDHLRRHGRILVNARAAALVTVPEARPLARLLRLQAPELGFVATADELESAGKPAPPAPRAADIALLQYTSGSTGNPKGVILTHANLLANIRAMGGHVRATSTDVFVSWMPLYHDMGLIGAWLGSLYYAIPLVVMSPLAFLARPERWLWAIHRHRATISGAPNFGYELCLRRIADADLEGLDLSSWRLAFNGAEPVSPDTLRRFSARFARYGFRPEALAPVYGLAECAVGLAFPPMGRAPRIDRVARETLERTGRAVPAAPDDTGALEFASCGRPLPGHHIRLVDSAGYEVGEREEGRLEFRGPSATSGYYRNLEETRRLLRDGWLDSGDLAYMARGELFVTGRVKDVVIRAGRNIHPQELEEVVGNLHGIRKGCVAVFGVPDPAAATERLVVLAETRETEEAARERLRARIVALAVDLTGAAPDDIVLAPPHSVLKTSSGKVRRTASRELYERAEIGRALPVWRQVARLAWAGALPQLRRASWAAASLLYAAYAWFVFWLLAPPVWAAVVAMPRPAQALVVIRAAARLLLRLTGTPWRVRGLEHLPPGPSIIVANHASYIDGIVLTAALPGTFSFVAKREFTARLIPRLFLRRIGAEFVERSETLRGVEDARSLARAAAGGRTLIFFPEGTFTRTPGLRAFHLGAFAAAAEADLPVVPVALAGTRSILRDDQWFPRKGSVAVTVGEPIRPAGSDWAAAIRLRDAARAEILRHCGEPDAGGAPLE
jgi:1-acyl-sn-glycerol-3-phosphate acyltransferase